MKRNRCRSLQIRLLTAKPDVGLKEFGASAVNCPDTKARSLPSESQERMSADPRSFLLNL